MDQLQVTSSITGIIAAATQVSNLLGQIKDAPASIIAVLTEVDHIKIIFLALQRFLDKATRLSGGRAALIQLEDVVVVLTQTVLVFSDLESLVSPISNGKRTSYPARLTWTRIQGRVMGLVNQLQRHKISLTLLLQIVQCDSDIQAREAAHDLQLHIEQQVEQDADLSRRLESLQLPADSMGDGNKAGLDTNSSELPGSTRDLDTGLPILVPVAGSESAVQEKSQTEWGGDNNPREHLPEASTIQHHSFNLVLASTRVYSRAKDGDIDAVSSISSTGSRGWSMLSGLSLTDISIISVIKLPLHEPELVRFRRLAPPRLTGLSRLAEHKTYARKSILDLETQNRHGLLESEPLTARKCVGYNVRRIKKELEDLERGPPSPCSAGPILVNVCCWKGTIVGPSSTPYAGGVFLLSIDFASEYPFRPTKVAFMTRVYHPNIKSDGTISLNILAEKQYPDKGGYLAEAFLYIREYLTRLVQLSIRSLLDNPNPDDYCEPEIAHVYKTNRVRYERTAREWTRKYAM